MLWGICTDEEARPAQISHGHDERQCRHEGPSDLPEFTAKLTFFLLCLLADNNLSFILLNNVHENILRS